MNLFRKLFLGVLIAPVFIQADVRLENRHQITAEISITKKTDSSVVKSSKTVQEIIVETSYDALRDCLAFCGIEVMTFFNEMCSFKCKLAAGLCSASLVALKCKLKNK